MNHQILLYAAPKGYYFIATKLCPKIVSPVFSLEKLNFWEKWAKSLKPIPNRERSCDMKWIWVSLVFIHNSCYNYLTSILFLKLTSDVKN